MSPAADIPSLAFTIVAPHLTPQALAGRVTRSLGTQAAKDPRYESSSRVPRHPWLSISADDDVLAADTATSTTTRIALLRLRQSMSCVINDAYREHPLDVAEKISAVALVEELLVLGVEVREVMVNGLAVNPGGLATTTRDKDRGNQFIGLHVDSWSKLPLAQRALARWRLCLNVGSNDRFLLFLRRPVDTLGAIASVHDLARSVNRTVREYMNSSSDTPAFRLRVRPGEAYVAPTENLIHDGSTAENSDEDRNFNLFGFFTFPS